MKQSRLVNILNTESFDKLQRENHESGEIHAYNIEYFLDNEVEAVKLQLGNLINAYGQELVTKQLGVLKRKLKSSSKVKKAA